MNWFQDGMNVHEISSCVILAHVLLFFHDVGIIWGTYNNCMWMQGSRRFILRPNSAKFSKIKQIIKSENNVSVISEPLTLFISALVEAPFIPAEIPRSSWIHIFQRAPEFRHIWSDLPLESLLKNWLKLNSNSLK